MGLGVLAILLLVVGLLGWLAWWYLRRDKTPLLCKMATISAVFVPVMGGMSVFLSLAGGFHKGAVILGISIFVVQWAFVFRSKYFQRRWVKNSFKIAFIINALIRLPISISLDAIIFMLELSAYEILGLGFTNDAVDKSHELFALTFFYTMTHGIVVQLLFALCLAIIHGLILLGMRIYHKMNRASSC